MRLISKILTCIFIISFFNNSIFGRTYGLGTDDYSDSTIVDIVSSYTEDLLLTLRSDAVHSMGNSLQLQIEKGKVSDNCSTGSGGVISVLLKPEAKGRLPIYKRSVYWGNNRALVKGGVFYLDNCELILIDPLLIDNIAGNFHGGGAIYLNENAVASFFIERSKKMLVKGNKGGIESNWLHMKNGSIASFRIEKNGIVDIYDKFSDESAGNTNKVVVTGINGKGEMNIYVGSEIGKTDVLIHHCQVNLKDEDDRLYKETSVLSHDTYLFHSLTVNKKAKLRAINKPIEIKNKEDVTFQNSTIELGVFADRFKDEYSNGNSKYSSINTEGKIELNKDTKIRISADKRRYEGEIKSIIMEGKKIEVKSTEIKNLLEFNKRCGRCKLSLEQDYEGTGRDRIIAKVKGNGLKTNLKKIDGLKKNEKAVAESLDKLSTMSSNKQYKLDKLITILDTMDMKGDELKVKEVFERNNGSFIANMVRSGGDRGERAVVYSRLDRKMKEDKSKVWANLKKKNNQYEGNKIEERYSEKSTGAIIGCDHDILISSKAVERARIGVYGEVTKEDMREGDNRGKATNVGLGVYGDIGKGKYDIRGLVEGGHSTYESEREIGKVAKEIEIKEYGNIGIGKANGKFGATYIGMDVECGMNFSVLERKFGVRPYVGIEGKINKYEGMKEEGVGVFALRMKEGMYNRLLGRLGVMVEQERSKYDWSMRLEYKRLMSSGEPEIKCSLSNGYYFNTTGNREGLDKFGIGISGSYKISSRLEVGLGAALEVSDNNRNLEGFVGLGYRFGSSLHSKSSGQKKAATDTRRNISTRQKKAIRNTKQEDISAGHNLGGSSSKTSKQKNVRTTVVRQKAKKIMVANTPEQLATLEFLFNSTKITPKTQKNLHSIANKLKKYPNRQLLITGHTDSIGEMKCNKNLSLRRAISVQKLLRNKFGIKNKMKVLGIGYRKPIASNKTSQGRQKNRRVSVSIQPNKLK